MKRKSKVIIGAGIGLSLLGTGALIFERRQKDMNMTEKEMDEQLEMYKMYEGESIKTLTQAEKEKISDMIKAMSETELRVVLENIPVGLMFDEVLARLAHYNAFASQIQNAMEYLPK